VPRRGQQGRNDSGIVPIHSVEPYLRAIAPSVTYCGAGEEARLVKLCHNLMLGIVTEALAEATTLAEKGGVPASAFLDFIDGSVLGCTHIRLKGQAIRARKLPGRDDRREPSQGLRSGPGGRTRTCRCRCRRRRSLTNSFRPPSASGTANRTTSPSTRWRHERPHCRNRTTERSRFGDGQVTRTPSAQKSDEFSR
jgi:hypothetical protein